MVGAVIMAAPFRFHLHTPFRVQSQKGLWADWEITSIINEAGWLQMRNWLQCGDYRVHINEAI